MKPNLDEDIIVMILLAIVMILLGIQASNAF